MKFGLAPPVKQAFEEIFRAPVVIKLLLVQLDPSFHRTPIMSLDYDGIFEEYTDMAVLAANPVIGQRMTDYLKKTKNLSSLPRDAAIQLALKAWAVGFSSQNKFAEEREQEEKKGKASLPSSSERDVIIKKALQTLKPEIAVLEEGHPGSSKFRTLGPKEMESILTQWVHPSKE
jgi:proteasome alpha subunit